MPSIRSTINWTESACTVRPNTIGASASSGIIAPENIRKTTSTSRTISLPSPTRSLRSNWVCVPSGNLMYVPSRR